MRVAAGDWDSMFVYTGYRNNSRVRRLFVWRFSVYTMT